MVEKKKSLQNLQDEFGNLKERVCLKLKELEDIEKEIKALTGRLVDSSTDKERKGLIAERAQAVVLRDAVLAEYNELQFRRDSAYLVIYEYKVVLVKEEANQWQAKNIQARHAMDQALSEMRHWLNRRDNIPEAEADKRRRELELNLAGIKSDNMIIHRDAERAKGRLERALNELVAARQALGVNGAGKP